MSTHDPQPSAWLARRSDWPAGQWEPFKGSDPPSWASGADPLYSHETLLAEVARAVEAERAQHQATLALQQRSYEREIELEVEAERETCAQVCERVAYTHAVTSLLGPEQNALKCAAAIREGAR